VKRGRKPGRQPVQFPGPFSVEDFFKGDIVARERNSSAWTERGGKICGPRSDSKEGARLRVLFARWDRRGAFPTIALPALDSPSQEGGGRERR